MNDEIGNAAGLVWKTLNREGKVTLARLRQRTGLSVELVNRAIGWLAREDKLNFEKKARSITISLKV
ncbi:MAG: winged helix-turn-helix domain-containing protein [Bacteroidota bacterium]